MPLWFNSKTYNSRMINETLQSLADPGARHALFVHFVVAFGALGWIPVLALLIGGCRDKTLKFVCLAMFLILSLTAGIAAGAGEEAEENAHLSLPPLTQVESDLLNRHEELGEGGWIWPLIPAVLVALTLVPPGPAGELKKVRVIAGVLALAAALGVSGWIAVTGHVGGRLVHFHGVGVPNRGAGEGDPSLSTEPMGEHD